MLQSFQSHFSILNFILFSIAYVNSLSAAGLALKLS